MQVNFLKLIFLTSVFSYGFSSNEITEIILMVAQIDNKSIDLACVTNEDPDFAIAIKLIPENYYLSSKHLRSKYDIRLNEFKRKPMVPATKNEKLLKSRNICGREDNLQILEFEITSSETSLQAKEATDVTLDHKLNAILPPCNLSISNNATCIHVWCNATTEKIYFRYTGIHHVYFMSELLQPHTTYHHKIWRTARGLQSYTKQSTNERDTKTFRKSNTVRELSAYSQDEHSISLRWKPPEQPTGIISNYTISYFLDGRLFATNSIEKCYLYHDYVCANLTGLSPNMEYSILVAAHDADKSLVSDETHCQAQTIQKPPEAPQNFKATITDNCTIWLEWEHPDKANGPIKYFIITYRSKTENSTCRLDVNGINCCYHFELTPSFSSATYDIFLNAVNIHEGHPSKTLHVDISHCQPTIIVKKLNTAPKLLGFKIANVMSLTLMASLLLTFVVVIIIVALCVYLNLRKRKRLTMMNKNYDDEELGYDLIKCHQQESDLILERARFCEVVERLVSCNLYDEQIEQEYLAIEDKMKVLYKLIVKHRFTEVPVHGTKPDEMANLNYIHGTNGTKTFIATNCPKGKASKDLFWQTVLSENVCVIVSLLTLSEADLQMNKYWPDDCYKTETKDILVRCTAMTKYTDFFIRHLVIESRTAKRNIQQVNFISFPIDRIPSFPQSFLNLLNFVKTANARKSPLMVHCSDGFGRTGVFIMCYNLLCSEDDVLNVQKCLEDVRKCRPYLVNDLNQYKFIYFMLNEILSNHKSGIDVDLVFEDKRNPYECLMQRDFKYIKMRKYTCKMYPARRRTFAQQYCMSMVDGYEGKHTYLTTREFRGESDIATFWKYVHGQQIKLIVVLQDFDEDEMKFWPDYYDEINMKMLKVKKIYYQNHNNVEIFRFIIMDSNMKEFSTTLLHCKGWEMSNADNHLKQFYTLYKYYNIFKSEDASEIVINCQNGIKKCGVFICFDLVLQKIKTENMFDLCWAVSSMQLVEPAFMDDLGQHELMYSLVCYYLDAVCLEDDGHRYSTITTNYKKYDVLSRIIS